MSEGYEILDLTAMESFPYHQRDGQKLLPVQRALDYRVAGINGWIGDAGEGLVPEHAEDSDNEELYVVVKGSARFTVDGEEVEAPAGTLLHLQPGENRVAVSEAPGTIVVAIGATVGKPFEPQGWTSFVVADHYRREGRIEDARAAIREMIDLHPSHWGAPYNAACFEALAGNADEAFSLLQQAMQLDTQAVRDFAPNDSDLDSLHDDPRWQKVAR
jgi:mannose-6-phosphate isomerase-like protein (cupin superfamily)